MIGYGAFITAIINFVILAFIIFMLVRYIKKMKAQFEKQEEAGARRPDRNRIADRNSRRIEAAGLIRAVPTLIHFTLIRDRLYRGCRLLAGYGDKLQCAIDTTDPGAVPGGSTKPQTVSIGGGPDGAELGSTCVEKHCFCPG